MANYAKPKRNPSPKGAPVRTVPDLESAERIVDGLFAEVKAIIDDFLEVVDQNRLAAATARELAIVRRLRNASVTLAAVISGNTSVKHTVPTGRERTV